MAKIAGRKNEGAWQSFNNWLLNADPDTVAALSMTLSENGIVAAAWNAFKAYCQQTGIPLPQTALSVAGWVAWICDNGFPLDVWIGKTAYDLYQPAVDPDDPNKTIYVRTLEPALRKAAIVFRHFAKRFQFASRQVKWTAQDTHPPQSVMRALRKANPEMYRAERRAKIDAAIERLTAEGFTPADGPRVRVEKKVLTPKRGKI